MISLVDWAQLDSSAGLLMACCHMVSGAGVTWRQDWAVHPRWHTHPTSSWYCPWAGKQHDLNHRTCPWPRHVAWTSHWMMLGSKREHFKGRAFRRQKQKLPGHLNLHLEQVWAPSSGLWWSKCHGLNRELEIKFAPVEEADKGHIGNSLWHRETPSLPWNMVFSVFLEAFSASPISLAAYSQCLSWIFPLPHCFPRASFCPFLFSPFLDHLCSTMTQSGVDLGS